MAKQENKLDIIVDAQNKSKRAFLEVKNDLNDLGNNSGNALAKFDRNFDSAISTMKKFTDKFSFMDKVVKRGLQGTFATAGIFAAASFKDFMQLNDGISQANTLYSQTKESQKQMYQDSIKMFEMIPTNFERITSGIYNTISAGADPEHATMYARKFGMGGVAGDADMDVVTTAAMGTMNAYKLEAKDLERVLDLQFMTVKEGITSYSELASSLGTGVLASAKGAGITLEELQGSIALITKNAIPANIATTSLNQLFNKFTDTKVIKEFKKYGVEIQDAKKNTRPLIEIFKDLNYQFDKRKLSSEQRKGFLKELVGSEQAARAIAPLLGDLEEFQRILDQMDNSDGAMREAYDDRLESLGNQIKTYWNEIKSLGVESLTAMDPLISKALEPRIQKQKIRMDIEDLNDSKKFEDNPLKKEHIEKEISRLEIKMNSIESTPVNELKEALDESTNQLKEINPVLGGFLDGMGSFILSFMGDEGETKRNVIKTAGKGVVATYGVKKGVDALSWFSEKKNIFKKGKNTENPLDLFETMNKNINANIVNVYGAKVNGGNGLSSVGKAGAGRAALGGKITNGTKMLPGVVQSIPSKLSFKNMIYIPKGYEVGGDKYNNFKDDLISNKNKRLENEENFKKIVNSSLSTHLKNFNSKKEKIESKVTLDNQINLDPKLIANVYIDGKNLPIQRVEILSEQNIKRNAKEFRRYSKY